MPAKKGQQPPDLRHFNADATGSTGESKR